MSPRQWYDRLPPWLRTYTWSWIVAALAVFCLANVLWAQTDAGGTPGVLGVVENNIVAVLSSAAVLVVGLYRIGRLERDYRDQARNLEDNYVRKETHDGTRALESARHDALMNRLESLHQSLKEIRANQAARTRRGAAEENP